MNLGNKIRELRKTKELSITALAEMIGTTRSYLSDIERGEKNPSIQMVEKIAEALDLEVKDLMNTNDEDLSPELRKLVNNAKQLPEEVLSNLNNMVESINSHFKIAEKIINGIPTKYTIDLDIKPEGLTEEEELKAQKLINRLKEIRSAKEPK